MLPTCVDASEAESQVSGCQFQVAGFSSSCNLNKVLQFRESSVHCCHRRAQGGNTRCSCKQGLQGEENKIIFQFKSVTDELLNLFNGLFPEPLPWRGWRKRQEPFLSYEPCSAARPETGHLWYLPIYSTPEKKGENLFNIMPFFQDQSFCQYNGGQF